MEKIQLNSQARDPKGQPAGKLKNQGSIPAVLYGHNVANAHLALSQNEFEKVFRKAGESTIIELLMPDGSVRNVLIQDVQRHYLTSQPIHVDFYEVKMTEKLTATVPLEFVGESNAVKTLGGTLVKVISEVEVECLPGDLPSLLEVDISELKSFDDILEVRDIKVSDKVEIKTSLDEVVAKVQPPRDVEAELAEPIVEDISQVEGAAEEKPAEGEEAEGGEKQDKE
jgi:large subunit ribosomal protein L25